MKEAPEGKQPGQHGEERALYAVSHTSPSPLPRARRQRVRHVALQAVIGTSG